VARQKKPAGFNIALLAILFALILIRLAEIFIYPGSQILPPDIFFAVAITELCLLWFYAVKEKERLVWVKRKEDELSEMKSKFTLITSHELMTPITVIKGYAALMRERVLGDITEQQNNALDIMDRYFERLENIKNNLAKLSLGTSGSLIETLRPESMGALIRVTAREVGPFLEKRHQAILLEIDKDIPQINMDPNGIQEVLINLLINAIRFTPDNGKIIVRAKDAADKIRVEVEDNGIGIPKEKLADIFESFYELQDIKKHSSGSIEFKSGGLGLGLTIARKIVEAHNGSIWAESDLGKYSRFIFTLPKK